MPPRKPRLPVPQPTAATGTDDRSQKFQASKNELIANINEGPRTKKDPKTKKYIGPGDVRTGKNLYTFKSLMCNKASTGYLSVKDQLVNINDSHSIVEKAQLLGYLLPYTKDGQVINRASAVMDKAYAYGGPDKTPAPFKLSTKVPGMKITKSAGGVRTISAMTLPAKKRIERTFARLTEHMYNNITLQIFNSVKNLKCVQLGQAFYPLDKNKGFQKKFSIKNGGEETKQNSGIGAFYLKAKLRRVPSKKTTDKDIVTSIGLKVTKNGRNLIDKTDLLERIALLSVKPGKTVTQEDYQYYVKQAVSNGAKSLKDIHKKALAAYETSGFKKLRDDKMAAAKEAVEARKATRSAAAETRKKEAAEKKEERAAARAAKAAAKAAKVPGKKGRPKGSKNSSPKKEKARAVKGGKKGAKKK